MQTLPKLTQGPTELFQANVVFGHASRDLDHAAIQGVSKAQLHEPQEERGKRARAQERERERQDKERDRDNLRKIHR